jgi:2-oxoglutarate ferredoxin oxidoreductase subunit alpha
MMSGRPAASSFVDGSRLIIEAAVRAGADVFVGYPITPANLLYSYSSQRFPVVLPAPDEITTLQWMSGFAAAGHLPVTATSYPGLALMLESAGMAYMMELPMVIVLAQRLGPATGTATCGAQGDILLLNGMNSGGYSVPVLCPSNLRDCWELSGEAVRTAARLRCPVVLLTSKEMVMTLQSFDLEGLEEVGMAAVRMFAGDGEYLPYEAGEDGVPPFLPVGSRSRRVRLTASTHDRRGDLQHSTPDALANTLRLQQKIEQGLGEFTRFSLDEQEGADTLVISFDITAAAARDAVAGLRDSGTRVSHLVAKTLLPVPREYLEIAGRYPRVVVAEENQGGQYRGILFGRAGRAGVSGVNAVGRLISPEEIAGEVKA